MDNQLVIRSNRDTLYSAAVFDLDAGPVTITLPDPGKRFMSMQVIDEDKYTPRCHLRPWPHLSRGRDGHTLRARPACASWSIPNDPADVAAVHALQDAIVSSRTAPATSMCRIGIR